MPKLEIRGFMLKKSKLAKIYSKELENSYFDLKKRFTNYMIDAFPNMLKVCKKDPSWFCLNKKYIKLNKNNDIFLYVMCERINSLIEEFNEEAETLHQIYASRDNNLYKN
ncbi:hypothetical protein SHELI_v1c05120 [Spiroplasma helicoides]|uniref:Uncharacterized protein n=1 Tax=Spiroplasma helicoides TaxID=216938 RepID=A0A1B3SKL8_9MOLU|nr:hypothetical protein [Spiroplasma helicoides]AOG60463.1 hypothetical protein SHELI_v1c05120 [Spiroplasma helicoides]